MGLDIARCDVVLDFVHRRWLGAAIESRDECWTHANFLRN